MTMHKTKRTVHFNHPFYCDAPDTLFPAGNYDVETDEELIEGISFTAYRKVQTYLHLKPVQGHPGVKQTLVIAAGRLEAALERDSQAGRPLENRSAKSMGRIKG